MTYIFNKKEYRESEIEQLISEIQHLKIESIGDHLKELILIFYETENYKLLDIIALIFSEVNNNLVLEPLIKKLNKIKNSNHTSTLIYACSEYDCGKYLLFFIDLLINGDYQTVLEVLSVLNAIKDPILAGDKVLAIKRLNDKIISMNQDEEKYEIFEECIETINDYQVRS